MKPIIIILTAVEIILSTASAQSPFDVQAYKTFLQNTKSLSASELRTLHNAGIFSGEVSENTASQYLDSIHQKYALTSYEQSLIQKHGFVVTSRLAKPTFMEAFAEIFRRDLPVYVSSDAILHSIHMSYDAILMDIEDQKMIPWLDTLLTKMHLQIPVLAAHYAADTGLTTMLKDLDVYITIPRKLLGTTVDPIYPENAAAISSLLQAIQSESPKYVSLFSESQRLYDFSQFTVRGHYTRWKTFSGYFKAMMWLGRTEMYLTSPKQAAADVPEKDIQRQTILAALTAEAVAGAKCQYLLDTLDAVVQFFVGESDNVTLKNMQSLLQETSIPAASAMLDSAIWKKFQNALLTKPYTFQRIMSQMLWGNPLSAEMIQPASAFLLLGQRFIVDSYITGNVVYDRIAARRMLPSSLDVLFALGNDGAAQLLESELQRYGYSANLAALRYMVDAYDDDFWKSTLYNGWLHSIRALNPPPKRDSLPAFMRTAAWWQQKMNTQLASWAELRHDNLLYAKQSYSGMIICSFPESYVEPIPEFYARIKTFADIANAFFGKMNVVQVSSYFQHLSATADTLQSIAQKTLTHSPITTSEHRFLQQMLNIIQSSGGCTLEPVTEYTGWYPRLYYTGKGGFNTYDALIADVHTSPTDEWGNMVGWVLHVGTGKIDMMILNATTTDGRPMSYMGPVYRYYEYVSTNFKRLTDEEWKGMVENPSMGRPPFVNLYLADSTGNAPGVAASLFTTDVPKENIAPVPSTFQLGQNFPNPFNSTTIIPFSVPASNRNLPVSITIFNTTGQKIATLLEHPLPTGFYVTRWNGSSDNGRSVASGVYFYTISIGAKQLTGKMMLLK
jgi:hypothetical protein